VNVVAVSTPLHPDWRWRIVDYAGDIVEESRTSFPTIHTAVAEGAKRLEDMNTVDRSKRPALYARPRWRGRPRPGVGG
jgi:hypothetical protein